MNNQQEEAPVPAPQNEVTATPETRTEDGERGLRALAALLPNDDEIDALTTSLGAAFAAADMTGDAKRYARAEVAKAWLMRVVRSR